MWPTKPIFIPYNKNNLIGSLLIPVFFITLAAWLYSIPYNDSQSEFRNIRRELSGLFGMIVFGLLFIAAIIRMFDKNLGIRISENGIYHNITMFSKGSVAWEEIKNIELVKKTFSCLIVIETLTGKKIRFQVNSLVVPYHEVHELILNTFKKNTSLGLSIKKRR